MGRVPVDFRPGKFVVFAAADGVQAPPTDWGTWCPSPTTPSAEVLRMDSPGRFVWLAAEKPPRMAERNAEWCRPYQMECTFNAAYSEVLAAHLMGGATGRQELLDGPCADQKVELESRWLRGMTGDNGFKGENARGLAQGLLADAHRQVKGQIDEFVTDRMTPRIREYGLDQLAQGRQAILAEARLYLGDRARVNTVLEVRREDVEAFVSPADASITAARRQRLRSALLPVQALGNRIDGRRAEAARHETNAALSVGRSPGQAPVERVLAQAESVRSEVGQLEVELAERLMGVGAEFPISWKTWRTAHLGSDEQSDHELLVGIVRALRRCYNANSALRRSLRPRRANGHDAGGGGLWRYPFLVDAAMNEFGVPEFCFARRVAEDQVRIAAGAGTFDFAANVISLAALAASLSAAVVPPAAPIALALNGVDRITSALGGAEAYAQYLDASNAFDAFLAPSKAFGGAPDAVDAAMSVGFGVIGAVL